MLKVVFENKKCVRLMTVLFSVHTYKKNVLPCCWWRSVKVQWWRLVIILKQACWRWLVLHTTAMDLANIHSNEATDVASIHCSVSPCAKCAIPRHERLDWKSRSWMKIQLGWYFWICPHVLVHEYLDWKRYCFTQLLEWSWLDLFESFHMHFSKNEGNEKFPFITFTYVN